MRRLLTLIALCAAPLAAQAQVCGSDYTVRAGDTVFSIAEAVYADPEKWTLIYYANEDLLKTRVFQVTPGDAVFIPCEPGSQQADATPLRLDEAELTLLTGSNRAPLTDRDWPGQGMVTELVNAALEMTPNPISYAIAWEDDRSQHLFPLLDQTTYDMGFPWIKPDCDSDPTNALCRSFHFSDAIVETLNLLFVNADSTMRYDSDADVLGKTLCRPRGQDTHDLDRTDRQWLSGKQVTLIQTETPDQCFDLLLLQQVDAVTMNIFDGAMTIDRMGIQGRVRPLDKPLSTEGLHVVIAKKHWRGTTHLYRLNAGLQALKQTDRYAQIVSKHLGVFWDRFQAD